MTHHYNFSGDSKGYFDSEKQKNPDIVWNEIKVGQTLFATNGDKVTVCEINEDGMIVLYKNKRYKRDRSILGKKLFLLNPQKNTITQSKIQIEEFKNRETLGPQEDLEESKCQKQNIQTKDNNCNNKKIFYNNISEPVDLDVGLRVNTRVNHDSFGSGLVIFNDKKNIKVNFDNGELIMFNYETCIKENILITDKKENINDNFDIQNLIKKSDYYDKNQIYNQNVISINRRLVLVNCNEIKYHLRLANCYKYLNKLEEAIEIYRKVLIIDNKNKVAIENMSIYGDKLYYKYNEKPFNGIHSDIGSPCPEDEFIWYLNEMNKIKNKINSYFNER